jgi:hypothetical protein
MTNPIYAYNHNDGPGKSITGAEFYSGTTFPADYRGDYFFGDYVGNYIKRYDTATGQVFDFATDVPNPVDIRTGPDGALYYLAVEAKKVVRIQYTGVVTPPPDPNTVSLAPVGDEHVAAASPTKNYGRSPLLYSQSGGDANRIFMKWDLSSLAGKDVDSATLQFKTPSTASSGSSAVQNVRLVTDASWSELALNWNNQPATSTTLTTFGPVAANTTYSITLPASAVQPYLGSLLSLAIDANNPVDSMFFSSRDAVTDRPALVIKWSDPAPPVIGEPPQVSIDAPEDGTSFRAGDTVSYSGSATDAEDGALAPASLTWEVVFHHDTHTHPFVEPYSGTAGGSFVVPDTGESSDNIWYRIHLRATDSDGNTSTTFRDVVPLKSTVTLATVPGGLSVLLDGSPFTAPKTFVGVENFKRQITAPLTQTAGGRTYEFVSWSDGGPADHSIQTPIDDATFTATYRDVTATGTEAVSDDFSRTVSNGWGTAGKGGAYVLTGGNANFAVAAGAATVTLPQANANKAAALPNVFLQDADVTVRVALDKVAAGNAGYAYAEVRVAGSNAYRPKLIFNANGTISVHAGVVVNGSESAVAPAIVVPGLTQSAGKFYWLRAQVTGVNPTTIKVKAWADGTAEPANWQFSATNGAAQLQTAGAVALRAYSRSTNAPVTYTFDDYRVVGQPPVTPPQGSTLALDEFERNTSSGWGDADTGGMYTVEGAAGAYSVTDDGGSMRMGAAGATRAANLPAVSASDVDARVRITADRATAGGNWYAYIQLRRNGTSALQPKIIVNANGTVSVQAGALVNGTESSLGKAVVVPGLTFTPGTIIWLRASVSGTNPATIKVKAWADGQAEPANWQFSATTNAAALQTPGSVGLRTYLGSQVSNAPVTVTFDDFVVTGP